MSPRLRLLLAAVVAVGLFGMMALAIRGTDPWTADARVVASKADAQSSRFLGHVDDLPDAEEGERLHGRALALSRDAHALLNHSATWGQAPGLVEARQEFGTVLEAYDAEVEAADFSSLTQGMVGTLGSVSGALADEARALAVAHENNIEAANDQASVVDTLFGPQVLAFEVLGILLTAAMIGALVIARPLDAPDDDSHYSHPTRQQVAESDHASDVAAHTLRNPPAPAAPAAPATKEGTP